MRSRAFSRELPRTNASDHPRRIDFQRGARNQFCLVEAALAKLGAVQTAPGLQPRTSAAKLRFERCNRFRQHASKNVRRRTHAAILQQMNQFAQSAFIAAIGDARARRAVRRGGTTRIEDRPRRLSEPHREKTNARRKSRRLRPRWGAWRRGTPGKPEDAKS